LTTTPREHFDAALDDPLEFHPSYRTDWLTQRLQCWRLYLLQFGRGSGGSKLRGCPFEVDGVRFGSPLIMEHQSTNAALDYASLVREGIPDSLRGELWRHGAGATLDMLGAPQHHYQKLLVAAKARGGGAARDIAKDVSRTLPMHPYYQSEEGLAALERVLCCYAYHNPRLGYTQSMNFLCAVFLLYMDEESAFWMLVAVCERLTPHSYRKSMVGSVAQLAVVERLVQQRLPKLYEHLSDNGFGVSMVATGWLMCIYISFLPWEICLRILDNFLCVGPNIVFRVAVALFILNENRLSECNEIEDFLLALQRRNYQAEEILSVAYWLEGQLKDEDGKSGVEIFCDSIVTKNHVGFISGSNDD
jgi:hypothetical protein